MKADADVARIEALARKVRRFLEPHWLIWHCERGLAPSIPSQWTCGRSSLFLQKVLQADGIDTTWMTGCPFDGDGNPVEAGFNIGDGWQGHSWLEAADFIVDITGDQFGLAAVSILPQGDERYRSSEDHAFDDAKRRRVETVAEPWKSWAIA